MKILISNDGPHALYYFRLGLAKAFTYAGHEVIIWDLSKKSAFDAFDEFEPDVFLGQTYNLNEAIIKCIKQRPHMYIALRASDYGNKIDRTKYPILYVRPDELRLVDSIRDSVSFLHIHHHPNWINETHGNWVKDGYSVKSIMNAADVFDYTGGKFDPKFATDICFIGGYWGYKSQTLSKWLLPLSCKMKIFGNQSWPTEKYCGFLDTKYVKDALKSATICPNISEPHSQDYGYDIIERPFKLLSNKCFMISDNVAGLVDLFPDQIYADNPKHFEELVHFYLENPNFRDDHIETGYKKVIEQHTYFHRAADIMKYLVITTEANRILTKYEELQKKIGL